MTTIDTTPVRDQLEQILSARDSLTPRGDGGAPVAVLDLLASPGVWESFADAVSTDEIGDARYATVLLGLAIDADRYLGDIPPALRAVAAKGFALLGIVDRILSEINHEDTVSFASVYELEQLPVSISMAVKDFKEAASEAYRDATWNKGMFTRAAANDSE